MEKLFKRIRKTISAFLLAGVADYGSLQPVYGIRAGIENKGLSRPIVAAIIGVLILAVALIIGLVAYFKKNRPKK